MLLLASAALLAPRLAPAATDGAATRAKLVQIQQERQRLAAAQLQMQSQLGSLGRQMHRLDGRPSLLLYTSPRPPDGQGNLIPAFSLEKKNQSRYR